MSSVSSEKAIELESPTGQEMGLLSLLVEKYWAEIFCQFNTDETSMTIKVSKDYLNIY